MKNDDFDVKNDEKMTFKTVKMNLKNGSKWSFSWKWVF